MKMRTLKQFIGLVMLLLLMGQPNYAAEEKFTYKSKGRRDPFIPLIGKGAELLISQEMNSIEGIVLQGIIFDPERESLAIVNGEIFKEGQPVGGFMLSRINERNIILIRDGKNYIVNLVEEE